MIKVLYRGSGVADCGVGWYRMISPLQELEKQGKIELKVMDFTYGEGKLEEPYTIEFDAKGRPTKAEVKDKLIKAMKWADIVYLVRDESLPYVCIHGGLMADMKKEFPKKKMIVDIDDYVQFTRPHNPGYISFHPGSMYNELNLKLLQIVDGVTCSTDFLKKAYSTENKKIDVYPNSIDVKEREWLKNVKPKIKKKKGEIRIGWAGSAAHFENLRQVIKPLKAIMEKYPQVTFHYTGLFGGLFDWPELQDRIRKVKFAELRKWPEKLKSMGLDIAIAPLVDNNFNRAKSNLRVLEYWSVNYPVIASPILPYKFIKDGKDGLLAMEEAEWFDALEKLILDEKLRQKLAAGGNKRLRKEYDVAKNCDIMYKILKKYIK